MFLWNPNAKTKVIKLIFGREAVKREIEYYFSMVVSLSILPTRMSVRLKPVSFLANLDSDSEDL